MDCLLYQVTDAVIGMHEHHLLTTSEISIAALSEEKLAGLLRQVPMLPSTVLT